LTSSSQSIGLVQEKTQSLTQKLLALTMAP
jgi:hypothetical protein